MNKITIDKSLIRKKERIGEMKGNNHLDKINYSEEYELKPVKYNRPVIVNSLKGESINSDIVSYQLYNCFNYSLFLPNGNKSIKCSIGITSPNPGEGKTTSACNLASAIAMGSSHRTVLVDLNLSKPSIHEIFGTPAGPGVSEALLGDDIFVTPTQVENLSVMPAGNSKIIPVKRLPLFHEIASSLFNEFDFVIVDMPAMNNRRFPTLIANQLNGLIVVVESRKTKRRDIDKVFRQVNEHNVIGFVINKIHDDDF